MRADENIGLPLQTNQWGYLKGSAQRAKWPSANSCSCVISDDHPAVAPPPQ